MREGRGAGGRRKVERIVASVGAMVGSRGRSMQCPRRGPEIPRRGCGSPGGVRWIAIVLDSCSMKNLRQRRHVNTLSTFNIRGSARNTKNVVRAGCGDALGQRAFSVPRTH
jgi:hypothetical protein